MLSQSGTRVCWLQLTEADVPPGNDWLSTSEALRLSGMRFAKRRADWRMGRWTAKCAIAVYLNLPHDYEMLAQIGINSSSFGAPEVFCFGEPAPAVISLSHRANAALCAIAPLGTALGCDLEMKEPHSDAFIADYFTAEEQVLVSRCSVRDRPWLVTLIWSAKESALKALRAGLRLDTRCVVVSFADSVLDEVRAVGEKHSSTPEASVPGAQSNWHPLQVRYANGQIFPGWWQRAGAMLQTLLASPPPAHPIRLELPSNRCQLEDGHDKMMRTHLLRASSQ